MRLLSSSSIPASNPSAGLLERYHATRNYLGLDACVACAAQYTSSSGSILDKPTVIRALRKVAIDHPALCVRFTKESTHAIFERLPRFDLNDIVHFRESDDDLQTIFAEQLPQGFDMTSGLPMWRVLVLKNGTVIFFWHHGFGDGRSGLSFHRAFVAALHSTSSEPLDQDSIVIPPSTPMLKSLDDLVDLSPTFKKFASEIYQLLVPVSWTKAASAWTGGMVVKKISLKTLVRIIEVSPEDMRKIMGECKKNKATLTAALQYHGLAIITQLIEEHKDGKWKTISSFIPLSLRPLSGLSDDAFCDHVSTLHLYTPLPVTFSWDQAAALTTKLRAAPARSPGHIGMLKYLYGKYEEFLKGKLGKKRQAGMEISNLGAFKYPESVASPEQRTWSIGKMAFSQCDAVLGAALKLNVVGDPLGGLTICLTWGEDVVSKEFAEAFAGRLEKRLGEMAHTSP